jgi:hypothetical protein
MQACQALQLQRLVLAQAVQVVLVLLAAAACLQPEACQQHSR